MRERERALKNEEVERKPEEDREMEEEEERSQRKSTKKMNKRRGTCWMHVCGVESFFFDSV